MTSANQSVLSFVPQNGGDSLTRIGNDLVLLFGMRIGNALVFLSGDSGKQFCGIVFLLKNKPIKKVRERE